MPVGRYARRMAERTELIERAVAAYKALGELAETIEDEWQYVSDLVEAYGPGLEALAAGPPLSDAEAAAVEEAIAEIGEITDAHRAIDWLSTFPHVVALAVGGDVDTSPGGDAPDGFATEGEADDDDANPFRALLRGGR
jgi:hypothetical protein